MMAALRKISAVRCDGNPRAGFAVIAEVLVGDDQLWLALVDRLASLGLKNRSLSDLCCVRTADRGRGSVGETHAVPTALAKIELEEAMSIRDEFSMRNKFASVEMLVYSRLDFSPFVLSFFSVLIDWHLKEELKMFLSFSQSLPETAEKKKKFRERISFSLNLGILVRRFYFVSLLSPLEPSCHSTLLCQKGSMGASLRMDAGI